MFYKMDFMDQEHLVVVTEEHPDGEHVTVAQVGYFASDGNVYMNDAIPDMEVTRDALDFVYLSPDAKDRTFHTLKRHSIWALKGTLKKFGTNPGHGECSNCIYFSARADNKADETDGLCRRFPPVPAVDPQSGETRKLLPHMKPHHWCGEYKRK